MTNNSNEKPWWSRGAEAVTVPAPGEVSTIFKPRPGEERRYEEYRAWFMNHVRVVCDKCWIWDGPRTEKGYGKTVFRGRQFRAHRLSWHLEHPDDPAPLVVMHKCDDPRCVNPRHLVAGDHLDNARDMVRKGRQRGGPNQPRKGRPRERHMPITDEIKASVIAARAAGRLLGDIAEDTGLHLRIVRRILNGQRIAKQRAYKAWHPHLKQRPHEQAGLKMAKP